ncbi:MAG TPA: ATP-binding protein, partial [Methylomirabilota bacterium]
MSLPLISLFIRHEQDVVAARQRARQIAARLGFETQDQTRIATAVSEIARNAFMYAGGGKVEIEVKGRHAPQLLMVRVSDLGPGIRDLDSVLGGRYRSTTGMGLGMLGARR